MTPKRILIKISGEALASNMEKPQCSEARNEAMGFNTNMLAKVTTDILNVYHTGIDIALVVGGGNFFRGSQISEAQGLNRTTADHMGMLATVLNGLALGHTLAHQGVETRVMSAIPMPTVCEPYIQNKAVHHLNKRRIVISVAGTGSPYFTTDSAAVLRASEMQCDLLIKGTKVQGVYDSDPHVNPQAKHLPNLTHNQALVDNLKVMDATAMALARDHNLSIAVCSIYEENAFFKAIHKSTPCTYIQSV